MYLDFNIVEWVFENLVRKRVYEMVCSFGFGWGMELGISGVGRE